MPGVIFLYSYLIQKSTLFGNIYQLSVIVTIFFPRASEAKTPAMQRRVKTVKMTFTLFINPGMLDALIGASPMNK